MALFRYVVLVVVAALLLAMAIKAIVDRKRRKHLLFAPLVVGIILLARLIDPRGLGKPTSDERHIVHRLIDNLGATIHRAVTQNPRS
jgi:hypothetical protein